MAILYDIDLEAGNLNEFDSSTTDGGDLSAHADAALAGTTVGMKLVVDDANAIYGVCDGVNGPLSNIRFRFYIDPNSLTMGANEMFQVATVNATDAPYVFAIVQLLYSSGYYIRLRVIDDGSTGVDIQTTAITDAPHYVEVLLSRASGADANDGVATIWIDGSQVGTKTDWDNYTRMANVTYMRFGAIAEIDAGTSGTFYMDQIVIRDDATEIGAYAAVTVKPWFVMFQ